MQYANDEDLALEYANDEDLAHLDSDTDLQFDLSLEQKTPQNPTKRLILTPPPPSPKGQSTPPQTPPQTPSQTPNGLQFSLDGVNNKNTPSKNYSEYDEEKKARLKEQKLLEERKEKFLKRLLSRQQGNYQSDDPEKPDDDPETPVCGGSCTVQLRL